MSQKSTRVLVGGATGAALYTFGQDSYPSVFRASEERPQVRFPYRWWEEDAKSIFWGPDAESMQRIIRYGLLTDRQLPYMALKLRSVPDVNDIISKVVSSEESVGLSLEQKADMFIRRCKPTVPPKILWGWLPARKDIDLDALVIAEAIESESYLHFTRIPYEELVAYSLGYPSKGVEWFLQQHTRFYAHMLSHLLAYPEEIEKYTSVEHYLRSRSPFAHRAIVRALLGAGFQTDLPNSSPGFEFFAGPIQRLFKELPPDYAAILKVLGVLGARFERVYLRAGKMNWTKPFSIAHSFLEDIRTADDYVDFARNLTENDEQVFLAFVEEEDFDYNLANRLSVRWELLSIEVWDCCRALPDLMGFIQKSLTTLFEQRNYHTLTALLNGLYKYSITASVPILTGDGNTALALHQVVPPEYFYLLDPSQNYAAYRQQYQTAAGIPFLIPHLREACEYGEPVLQNLQAQMRAVIPQQ
ncbi:uncharacterized protein BDV17DRAFT_201029 [Aspergillus undulatus]|uniref:uncharacterized protein n=1 Tax=Aspergillus undulatus TaxID=1810928 RepID=UPI003CCD0A6E